MDILNTTTKSSKKSSVFFLKLHSELDLEKYKLAKYQELFKLSSFQSMHDADLAYHKIYRKCAENSWTKETLLHCLEEEEKFIIKHPDAFDADTFKQHTLNAIKEIKHQLKSGALDYLYV
ncbi:MAG TPA: hypothetical protein VK668_08030 [Mucilaginibacter sp.]|nr:hypothetical protein [Mucilaginibacter sp.]